MYFKNWTRLLEHFVCIFCIKIMRIFCLICELAKILLKQTCPLEKQPALHSKHTFCAPEGLIFNLRYANLTGTISRLPLYLNSTPNALKCTIYRYIAKDNTVFQGMHILLGYTVGSSIIPGLSPIGVEIISF